MLSLSLEGSGLLVFGLSRKRPACTRTCDLSETCYMIRVS